MPFVRFRSCTAFVVILGHEVARTMQVQNQPRREAASPCSSWHGLKTSCTHQRGRGPGSISEELGSTENDKKEDQEAKTVRGLLTQQGRTRLACAFRKHTNCVYRYVFKPPDQTAGPSYLNIINVRRLAQPKVEAPASQMKQGAER
jgi:hypothetical protein